MKQILVNRFLRTQNLFLPVGAKIKFGEWKPLHILKLDSMNQICLNNKNLFFDIILVFGGAIDENWLKGEKNIGYPF